MRHDIEDIQEDVPTSPELQPLDLVMITLQTHHRISSMWKRHLCTPPRIRSHPHSARDQVRSCYHRDHARHRFHRCQRQYNAWPNGTRQSQRRLLHQDRLHAHSLWTLRQSPTPLLRFRAQDEAGVVASGVHLKAQPLGLARGARPDKRNLKRQKPRKHRPRAPCGQKSLIIRSKFTYHR